MANRRSVQVKRSRTWGDELAFWRLERGLKQDELGRMVNVHQTRVSQFELGKAVPTPRDALMFDRALETGGHLVRAYELVSDFIRNQHPDWFQMFVALEREAVSLRGLHDGRISGLLQTEAYMRTLFCAYAPNRPPAEIDAMAHARLERQDRFFSSDDPPLFISLLEQATLERTIGGPVVMREQLRHLLAVMEHPNVIIQVLPFEATASALMTEMIIIETRDGHQRVYSESLSSGHFTDDEKQVRHLSTVYDRARAAALSEADSARLIQRIMRGLNRHVPNPRPEHSSVAQEQLLAGRRRVLHRGGPRIARPRPRA
ncbi:helix-turn-helix domain-containing protein [Kitasatospora sp. NPDC054939]